MGIEKLLQEGDVIEFTKKLKVGKTSDFFSIDIDRNYGTPTKVEGQYVVEKAGKSGGGWTTGRGYDPEAWEVKARELVEGKYDPHGRQICFTDSDWTNSIDYSAIKVVGKMRRTYEWINK